jgi:hypothetical protein
LAIWSADGPPSQAESKKKKGRRNMRFKGAPKLKNSPLIGKSGSNLNPIPLFPRPFGLKDPLPQTMGCPLFPFQENPSSGEFLKGFWSHS